jgi:hypothetical protein
MEDQNHPNMGQPGLNQSNQEVNTPSLSNSPVADKPVITESVPREVTKTSTLIPPENPPKQTNHSLRVIFIIIIGLLILAGTPFSVYTWQHKELDSSKSKVTKLQSQLASLSSSSGSFTYTPHYGNFSLTLPRSYGVVSIDDGCPCNKPYTDINIFPRINNSVFNESPSQTAYIYVLDSYNGDLNAALNAEEKNITSAGYKVIKVTDSSVDGITAKYLTITSNGQEYLVGSGKWLDGIVLNGSQTDILKSDILKGFVIKDNTKLSSYNLQSKDNAFYSSIYKGIRKFFMPKN